jgi:hypothetical protein
MINLLEEDWFMPGVKQAKIDLGESAKQVAIIIDEEVVLFVGVNDRVLDVFLNGTNFAECESMGGLFCTSYILGEYSDQILSNEMTQAALLSNPQCVIVDKDVQRHAELAEIGWLYQNGQFVVPGVYE